MNDKQLKAHGIAFKKYGGFQLDSLLYSPSLDHFNINESTVAELGENAHRDFDNETESEFTF